MRLGINDAGFSRIAQAVQQQQGLQIVDASPTGEDEVYYFSDDMVIVATSNAWDDPDEGQMWLVRVYNPDGSWNMEPDPYFDLVRQQYGSGTAPKREETLPTDSEWIRKFRSEIPEVKRQYDEKKKEQHEQEGEELGQSLPNVKM